MTVLCHIDMCRITPSMPYYAIYALSRTTERKIKKIAKCHILYTPYYPVLPYLSSSFTSTLTLHIDTNWKSVIYASSKHNVHNVTHKSVKQKVSKSNKVSHRVCRTYLLAMAYLPRYCLLSPAEWLSWRTMRHRVMPRLLSMAHFAHREGHISLPMNGTSRTSRRALKERVSWPQEGPRARKNVTHIVTILCFQGAPRVTLLLPIYPPTDSFFLSKFPIL